MLDLGTFLPFRLSVLSNAISNEISVEYRKVHDLSVPQWRVIAVLCSTPGLTATELCERTVMDKVAVSRAVSDLVKRALIERRALPEDGRASALVLTRKGRRLYDVIAPKALDYERALLEKLTREERATLDRILSKLSVGASPDRSLW